MQIKASYGSTIDVLDNHPNLASGIFGVIDCQNDTGLELDFLNFVFFGKTRDPTFYAKLAYVYGLRVLAMDTFLSNVDAIEIVTSEIQDLFVWDELPDRLAVQILGRVYSRAKDGHRGKVKISNVLQKICPYRTWQLPTP